MLILIGGTGFIGRHICERLHRSNIPAVTISKRPDQDFLCTHAPSIRPTVAGSIDALDALSQAQHVIYLAHQSRPSTNVDDVPREIEMNVKMATEYFEKIFSINPSCAVYYLSSGGQIYGSGHSSPIPESASPQPNTVYGLGKQLIEDLLLYYHRRHAANVMILRAANPVGRWQLGTSHGLVSSLVKRALRGQPITIFGSGENSRDYFDIEDLTEFMVQQIAAPPTPGVFNIGSGQPCTEKDVIALVEAQLGAIDVRYAPGRSFDLRYGVLDVEKARVELGWHPRTDLSETIRKMIEYEKSALA